MGKTSESTIEKNEALVSAKELYLFRANSAVYLEKFPEETKLKYGLKKVFEATDADWQKWVKKVEDIELENAAEDENKIIQFTANEQTGKRVYRFTREGLKKRDEIIEKEFTKPAFKITPYYVTDLPKDLHENWIKVFTPFVIKPIQIVSKAEKGV